MCPNEPGTILSPSNNYELVNYFIFDLLFKNKIVYATFWKMDMR